MDTNINPFQKRAEQKENADPFQKRLEQREKASDSLWDQFTDMLFSSEETPFEQGLGQAMRAIGPTIAGIPGDFVQLAKLVSKKGKHGIGEHLDFIPTSQSLTEKFDVATEGKYQPGSRSESLAQEFGSDVAALMLPAKGASSVLKALGVAAAGNLAKEGVKELGAGETAQNATKIGTMFLTSLFNPKGAQKYTNSLYNKAYAELPKEAIVDSKKFVTRLDALENNLSRGLKNVPSKAPVLNAIEDVKRNVKYNTVDINELLEAKKNLNEQRRIRIYDPELRGQKKVQADLKKHYGQLSGIINEAIEDYGKTNPSFLKSYKMADNAYAGIQQSQRASEFISRNIKDYKFHSGLGALAQVIFSPGTVLPTAAAAGAAFSGLKSYELMHRIFMNPTLRKYYVKSVLEASKENAPALMKNIRALDKAYQEEYD